MIVKSIKIKFLSTFFSFFFLFQFQGGGRGSFHLLKIFVCFFCDDWFSFWFFVSFDWFNWQNIVIDILMFIGLSLFYFKRRLIRFWNDIFFVMLFWYNLCVVSGAEARRFRLFFFDVLKWFFLFLHDTLRDQRNILKKIFFAFCSLLYFFLHLLNSGLFQKKICLAFFIVANLLKSGAIDTFFFLLDFCSGGSKIY